MAWPEKNYQSEVRYVPDFSNDHTVKPEAILANTNKAISIPEDAIGVHVYNGVAAALYFKLDAAWSAVPNAAFVSGGFMPKEQESARVFSRGPIGAGHSLNLISSGAGDIVVEFLKEPEA
jgi:hypothetical protein